MPEIAPYGTWRSEITTDLITQGAVSLGQVGVDDDTVYWTELRPWEAGRTVLVRRSADGARTDMTPSPMNVRSRVHEYGGLCFVAGRGGAWFVNGSDNRIYRADGTGRPVPVTRKGEVSFADLILDEDRERLIAVREDFSGTGESSNSIVAIGFDGSVSVLAQGADFYAFPRLSPDGADLAWVEWRHPNMPWDGTELKLSAFDATGKLTDPVTIAGGMRESIFQPGWSPGGELYYVSDRSGYWNLYRAGTTERHYAMEAECGLPLWQFGMSTYAFLNDEQAVLAHAVDGEWRLGILNLDTGALDPVATDYVSFNGLVAHGGKVWFTGGLADAPDQLVEWKPAQADWAVLRRSSETDLDPSSISKAQTIRFPTADGRQAYAYFYPPANAAFHAPDTERPPLIVKGHGGPTGQSSNALALKIQYWTSRGFAVVDVNYGGSTGYGRDYRQRLDGKWGVVDVEDCVNAARYLADQGMVDGDRMAITGGSAGGFTVLSALTFHDVFKAGCSAYGIGDLEALTRDTHKFESRYLDRLVGEWPEHADLYRRRSPIHHTELLSCPVIFLQGADDKVVPPNQAESMVAALKEKGLPVAYLLFDGEGHGFRRAENVRRALEAELSFYAQVFGFTPGDGIEPVRIENL